MKKSGASPSSASFVHQQTKLMVRAYHRSIQTKPCGKCGPAEGVGNFFCEITRMLSGLLTIVTVVTLVRFVSGEPLER